MLMKKFIAIALTTLYLCFTAGSLIRSDLDFLSYEALIDGKGREKNESETSKGIETFHIHQADKSCFRLKIQDLKQKTALDEKAFERIFNANRQGGSDNNSIIIDHPLFLKNKVFRL